MIIVHVEEEKKRRGTTSWRINKLFVELERRFTRIHYIGIKPTDS